MKFKLIRDVTPQECDWLDQTVKQGTTVYEYNGYTYGCIASGIAVTLKEDKTPFFELPLDALEQVQ